MPLDKMRCITACAGCLLSLSVSAGEADLKHPDWHPDGAMLIAEGSCHGNIGLYLVELAENSARLLFDSVHVDGYPRWFADGERIVFHQIDDKRQARLFVARVSADGDIANVERVTSGPFDIEPAPSPDSMQIAFSSAGDTGLDISVLDLQTNEQHTWRTPAAENFPSWHPDGHSILYHARDADGAQVYLRSLQTDEIRQLTQGAGPNMVGHLDNEGARLVFSSERDGDREIYLKDLERGDEARLTTRAGRDGYPKFSPDGERIAYHRASDDGSTSLRILDLASGETRDFSCASLRNIPTGATRQDTRFMEGEFVRS